MITIALNFFHNNGSQICIRTMYPYLDDFKWPLTSFKDCIRTFLCFGLYIIDKEYLDEVLITSINILNYSI